MKKQIAALLVLSAFVMMPLNALAMGDDDVNFGADAMIGGTRAKLQTLALGMVAKPVGAAVHGCPEGFNSGNDKDNGPAFLPSPSNKTRGAGGPVTSGS